MRSRSARGGGKYSSSVVVRSSSTPSRGRSTSSTASTSSSGAEAPAALQAAHSSTPEGSDLPVLDETAYLEALRAALLDSAKVS